MFKKYFLYLKKTDWQLTLAVVLLVASGLMALYSIESAGEDANLQNFYKQLIFFGIGIILLGFFSILDYRYLRTYSFVLLAIGIASLLAVIFFGTTVRGTRGWFVLFGDQALQPVEFIKIIMIIALSKLFTGWRAEVSTVRHLAYIFVAAIPLIALVLLQPDFGSAIILSSILLGMLTLVRMKRIYLVWIIVLIITVSVFSWFFVLQDYQKDRVLTLFDSSRDPYGSGYNIKQSIIAVGSGNLLGRGLGLGPQSRLDFLPAQETDFIFAVIAEGRGMVGVSLLLLFFSILIFRLLRIARLSHDDFAIFTACGIAIYFVMQGVLNIGMNIGLLPVAGVPLPFVSYGGSSLIASFIAIGIVQSIYIRNRGPLP